MATPDRWGPRAPQVRGGWRCSLCNINFPNDRDKFKQCPACGDECHYMSNVTPDEDWLEQVAQNISRWEGGDHDTFPIEWLIPETPEAEDEGETGTQGGS